MTIFNIVGTINPPNSYSGYTELGSETTLTTGPFAFISNLVQVIIIVAGIFTLINFITAGYMYLTSEGDPQKLTQAGVKILQSIIGITVVAAAYVIAAIIGQLFFKDASFLMNPTLFKLLE